MQRRTLPSSIIPFPSTTTQDLARLKIVQPVMATVDSRAEETSMKAKWGRGRPKGSKNKGSSLSTRILPEGSTTRSPRTNANTQPTISHIADPRKTAGSPVQKKQRGRPKGSKKSESTTENYTDASTTRKILPRQSPRNEKGGAKSSKDTISKKSKNTPQKEQTNSADDDEDLEDSDGQESDDSQTPPMKKAKLKSNQADSDSVFKELELRWWKLTSTLLPTDS
jgi:hypothetical protein